MDPESTPGKKGEFAVRVEGFAAESFRHGLCSAGDQAMTDRNREEGLSE
jgi:hypothetical protein